MCVKRGKDGAKYRSEFLLVAQRRGAQRAACGADRASRRARRRPLAAHQSGGQVMASREHAAAGRPR